MDASLVSFLLFFSSNSLTVKSVFDTVSWTKNNLKLSSWVAALLDSL